MASFWEINDKTIRMVRKRLHDLAYALLTVTSTTLKVIDSESKKSKITETMMQNFAKISWHLPCATA